MFGLGAWTWVVAGLILIGVEVIAPGFFMLWLGLAALAVGLVALTFGIGWQAALTLFAVVSVALVIVARRLQRHDDQDLIASPNLNRRTQALIGREFELGEPIRHGEGRLKINDTVWRVTGPETEAGARVRVTGVDGTALRVAPV